MECRNVRRAIPSLLDGFLDEEQSSAVRRHMAGCPACRDLYRAYEHDAMVLGEHLQRAPRISVVGQVMDQIEGDRATWWDWVVAGGNKVAAGVGVAVVLLVVVAGGFALREMAGNQTGDPGPQDMMLGTSETPEDTTSANVLGAGDIDQIVNQLDEHGLVFDVGGGFGAGSASEGPGGESSESQYSINYHRIAFDRHLTLLEFEVDTSVPLELSVEIVDAEQPERVSLTTQRNVEAGTTTGWLVFRGFEPNAANQSIAIESMVASQRGEPTTSNVQVDLSALQELPDPQPYSTDAYANGVEMCCLTIERGVAVSLVRWNYQVRSQDELVPVDEGSGSNAPAPYPSVSVDGEPVSVLSHFFGLSEIGTGHKTAAVFNLPASGELGIGYDHQTVLTGQEGERDQPQNFRGPWTLSATLGEPGQNPEPTPTPEPTIPPNVASENPNPTPDRAPGTGGGDPDTEDETLMLKVYMARGDYVGVSAREVPHTLQVATAATEELLSGPTSQENKYGLHSEIPEGTQLHGITLENGVATVDLSKEFFSGSGSTSMTLRVAQIVFTLTQFDTIDSVLFNIDGQPVEGVGGTFRSLRTSDGEGIDINSPINRGDLEMVTPAVLVENPVPGGLVSGPLELSGTANTFEATFGIEVVDASGEVIYDDFAMASSGTGTRGTFDLTIPLQLNEEGPGTITVYTTSARDGSRTNVVEIPVELEVGCVSCEEQWGGQDPRKITPESQ